MAANGSRDERRPTVAMMLWNTCENDSRVIKEATTLASAGYDVNVVCLAADHLPDLETRDGVTYRRVIRVLGPVKERVDAVLGVAGTVLASLAAFLLTALAVGIVGALLWTASGLAQGRVEVLVLLLGGLGAGLLLGSRLRRLRRSVLLVRRRFQRMPRVLLGPLRSRILWVLYRVLTFRLVHFAMGSTVAELRPDIIHAHDLQTLPAAARLAERLGARLVYDSHELALNVSNPPIKPLRWWMKGVERRAIRQAAGVITVSEGIAELLRKRYGIARPIVVYNAPPVATERKGTRDVRSDIGLAGSIPLALYVGAPSFHRGLEVLFDALALLPEFHLALVGPRSEAWEADLTARAEAAGTRGRVYFLDPVPIERLLGYLSTADVGVIAYQNVCLNHEHCMPNKLFETVLAGVPLVVADLQDLRGFVEKHRVGRAADETDPAALAEAMRDVASQPELRPSGARLERLQDEFGWKAQGAKLLALYAGIPAARSAVDDPAAPIAL